MTTFNPDKPIYLQMAERLCDEILAGTYSDDDRVPSVREYAVMLEVNTNTAVKAYDALARDNVIYNRRGLGYFVSPRFHGPHPAVGVPRHEAARDIHRRHRRRVAGHSRRAGRPAWRHKRPGWMKSNAYRQYRRQNVEKV